MFFFLKVDWKIINSEFINKIRFDAIRNRKHFNLEKPLIWLRLLKSSKYYCK